MKRQVQIYLWVPVSCACCSREILVSPAVTIAASRATSRRRPETERETTSCGHLAACGFLVDIGGVDEARTRDLRRDRQKSFLPNLLQSQEMYGWGEAMVPSRIREARATVIMSDVSQLLGDGRWEPTRDGGLALAG
jgi:hypothetical protein